MDTLLSRDGRISINKVNSIAWLKNILFAVREGIDSNTVIA